MERSPAQSNGIDRDDIKNMSNEELEEYVQKGVQRFNSLSPEERAKADETISRYFNEVFGHPLGPIALRHSSEQDEEPEANH